MGLEIACVGGLTLDWLGRGGARDGPYPGGNALYAAVGAWLASATPVIVARVGSDYPNELLDEIAAHDLSVAFVRRTSGNSYRVLLKDEPKGREVSYLDGSGNNRNLDSIPAELALRQVKAAHICPARVSTQCAILDERARIGCSTTLDILFVTNEIEPTAEEILDLMPRADVFLPSWAEIRRVWRDDTPVTAIRRLRDAGCRAVVMKMGADGCLGCDGGAMLFMPAIPAKIVDTTGAGDAFCGAFHAKWVTTGELALSIAWGSAAASIVIESHGALPAATRRARLEALRRSVIGIEEVAKRYSRFERR